MHIRHLRDAKPLKPLRQILNRDNRLRHLIIPSLQQIPIRRHASHPDDRRRPRHLQKLPSRQPQLIPPTLPHSPPRTHPPGLSPPPASAQTSTHQTPASPAPPPPTPSTIPAPSPTPNDKQTAAHHPTPTCKHTKHLLSRPTYFRDLH